jgi:hypothetical protein
MNCQWAFTQERRILGFHAGLQEINWVFTQEVIDAALPQTTLGTLCDEILASYFTEAQLHIIARAA